jgi:hypothetical protein
MFHNPMGAHGLLQGYLYLENLKILEIAAKYQTCACNEIKNRLGLKNICNRPFQNFICPHL